MVSLRGRFTGSFGPEDRGSWGRRRRRWSWNRWGSDRTVTGILPGWQTGSTYYSSCSGCRCSGRLVWALARTAGQGCSRSLTQGTVCSRVWGSVCRRQLSGSGLFCSSTIHNIKNVWSELNWIFLSKVYGLLTVVLEQRTSVGTLVQYCFSSSTMSQFSTAIVTVPLSGVVF